MFRANLPNLFNNKRQIIDNKDQKSLEGKRDYFKFEQLGYFKLLENGTYYYPAWKHYNRKTNVFCDRCNKQNLRASIGFSQFDLCLTCVDNMTKYKYECPSRYCHETRIIRDNMTNNARPEYIDINKYYQDQYLENNKEKYVDKVENFDYPTCDNTNNKYIAVIIVFIVIAAYCLFYKNEI
jgi:hypothetical protein